MDERGLVEIRIEKLKSEIVDALSKDFDEDYKKDIYALNKIFGDTLLIGNIAQTFRELASNYHMKDSRIIIAVSTLCFNEISKLLYESKESLKELKKKLKDINKMMLFLGTGVSFEADLDWNITSDCLDLTFGRKLEEHNSESCWDRLKDNEENRIRFQEIFTGAIKEKAPSAPHYYLASLFKEEIIEYLVCFNWDNLIESAYREVYHLEPSILYLDHRGNSEKFCKPHGCVKCEPPSDHSWTFPSEITMNSYFEKYTKESMGTKRVLFLSCGFGGSEQLKKYLKDLYGCCFFYDIRPDIRMFSKIKLSNEKSRISGKICMSPSRVLKEIINELYPNIFEFLLRQRDINSKTLESIERDKETYSFYFKKHELEKVTEKTISKVPQQINIESVQGDVINIKNGVYNNKKSIHIQTLNEIFKTLEWNRENTERIKNIERSMESNEIIIKKIQSFIQELVKTNASNKSFMTKLKDFAKNISTSIPGSVIANAILKALESV
jgi:NAD-dependent SIR2 family protein deacetylase